MKENNGMVYRVATKEEGTSYARTRAFVDALNTGKSYTVMSNIAKMTKDAVDYSSTFAESVKDHEYFDDLIKYRNQIIEQYAGKIVYNLEGQFGLVVQSSHSKGYSHLSVIVLDGTEVLRETTWSLNKIAGLILDTRKYLLRNYNIQLL